jgi:imidazolonepropionase-like amidohydrolase
VLGFTGLALAWGTTLAADGVKPQTLFTNVHVFDGVNDKLAGGMSVLIEGNLIKQVASSKIEANADATVIDGGGRTLMPGLIDAHVHMAINNDFVSLGTAMQLEDVAIRTVLVAESLLEDGFTTVRDLGGPVFATRRAIDSGLIPGPRIYPSGAFISQTSGHGDFRHLSDPNPLLSGEIRDTFQLWGFSILADGVPRVLAAARENLRAGASQIKIMAGGGAASIFDPIHVSQFLPEEIDAAVRATADWDTYVTAHIFTGEAITRALNVGVMGVDHGFLIDEPAMQLLVEKGAFFAPQWNAMSPALLENPALSKFSLFKVGQVQKAAADNDLVGLVNRYQPKMPFASDTCCGGPDVHTQQRRFELWYRAELFGNHRTLRDATSVAGELMELTGQLNPYPGRLGVVEEGALADLLLVDGNPLEDITLIGAQETWWGASTDEIETIRLIMKDGKVYKNTL